VEFHLKRNFEPVAPTKAGLEYSSAFRDERGGYEKGVMVQGKWLAHGTGF